MKLSGWLSSVVLLDCANPEVSGNCKMGDSNKKTEAMLRAVLISSPRGVPVYRLDREYKSITFQSIPFRQLGHSSLEAYLKSIPSVACFSTYNGETVIKGVASEADQHVAKLIAKQKKPKLRKSAPTRKPFSSATRFSSRIVSQTRNTRPVLRFVPPRLQKQSPWGGIANMSGSRTHSYIRKIISSSPSQATYPTSNRKVEVMSVPLRSATKKVSELITVKLSGSTRTVSSGGVSSSKSSPEAGMAPLSPSTEAEFYEKMKELLVTKPNGIWHQRFQIEFKKMFSEELPQDILDSLPSLPHIVRVERPMQGRILLYPLKEEKEEKEEKVPSKRSGTAENINVEVYTLCPQSLPELHQSHRIVSVTHVDDLEHFFVQYKDMWNQIDTLQESLQSIQGSSGLDAMLPFLQTGMFCCAQFTEDDQWYRARITEVLEEKDTHTVQVIYVDFGNYEYLPLCRLHPLEKEHAELPMGAVLCRLDEMRGLDDGEWKTEATEKLKELTGDSKEFKMTVVKIGKHHLHVQLCDENNVDLASNLVREGLAARLSIEAASDSLPTSSSSTSSISTTSVSIDSENTSPQRSLYRPRFTNKNLGISKGPGRVQIPDEQYLDLFVCNVLATDNICVSIYGAEYSDKLTALEQSMVVYYADPPQDKVVQPRVGDIFASYSKDVHAEGQWYRVQVTEVTDDNVKIEFVDYGDTRVVPASDLKAIPPRFLELPFQAFSVALNGVPKTKNPEVIENLKRHAQSKLLVGEVVKRTEDSVLVELINTSTEADININSILRLLVIPDDMMKPVLPKDGEVVDVCVTYVSEGGDIFVQIPGAGITRLNELMEDITEHYSKATKAAEFMSSPRVGKICCAKCSDDGVWYRAVITQVLPDRQVEVQYVDYGNKECLPSSSLREPTKANEHVSSLPFQAVVCRLAGVSKESWNEDTAYKMMDVISDQTVTLQVVKTGDCPLVALTVTKDEEGRAVSVVDLLFEGEQETTAQDSSDDSSTNPADKARPVTEQQTAESSSADVLPVFSLPSQDWVDVTVTDVIDPSHFTFQPLTMLQSLEELTNKMAEHYTDHKVRMSDMKIGVICAAFHPEHGQWYRAIIKAVLSPYQICVRFADYGDFGIVPSANLQPLADEFKQQALLGIQGSLSGLIPCATEWSEEAKKRFEELVLQKMLVAKVMFDTNDGTLCPNDERRIPLFLYDTSTDQQDLEISNVLVTEGFAKYTEK